MVNSKTKSTSAFRLNENSVLGFNGFLKYPKCPKLTMKKDAFQPHGVITLSLTHNWFPLLDPPFCDFVSNGVKIPWG